MRRVIFMGDGTDCSFSEAFFCIVISISMKSTTNQVSTSLGIPPNTDTVLRYQLCVWVCFFASFFFFYIYNFLHFSHCDCRAVPRESNLFCSPRRIQKSSTWIMTRCPITKMCTVSTVNEHNSFKVTLNSRYFSLFSTLKSFIVNHLLIMIHKEKVVGHAVTACLSCAFWNVIILWIFFWFLLNVCGSLLQCLAALAPLLETKLTQLFLQWNWKWPFRFYRYHQIKFSVFKKAIIKSVYMICFF